MEGRGPAPSSSSPPAGWTVPRMPDGTQWDNRTSLIIDPPDGQFPSLTPDAAGTAIRWWSKRHEGNYSMEAILAGARRQEAQRETKK